MNAPRSLNIILLCCFSLLYSMGNAATIHSVQSGGWKNQNTWDCQCPQGPGSADSVVIQSGHTVTLNSDQNPGDLTILTSGTLDDGGNQITVADNFHVDGTYTGSGDLLLNGVNSVIAGTGSIGTSGVMIITGGDKTTPSTADLIKTGNNQTEVDPNNIGITIHHHGTFTFEGPLKGSASSNWINEANATLKVKDVLFSSGSLDAEAAGNQVVFFGSDQTVPQPLNSTYHHLTCEGTGTKTLAGNLILYGDLSISSTLDPVGNNIQLEGDWTNNGAFTEGTGKVTFNGTADQSISASGGETFYHLEIDKAGGVLSMNNRVTVSNTLTMLQGDIKTNGNTLTLGTGATATGTLDHVSGSIFGCFKKWIGATPTTYLFPIGANTYHRPASITPSGTILPGTLKACFSKNSPTNDGLPLEDGTDSIHNTFSEGSWKLSVGDGLDFPTYDIDLTGNGFSTFNIHSATRILTRNNSSNPWTNPGTHVSGSGTTVERDGVDAGFPAHHCLADTTNCSPPNVSAISGANSVCQNDKGITYSVTENSGSTYDWSVIGGIQVSGDSTHEITVDWGSTGMTGSVIVSESNDCASSAPETLSVDIHSIPPAEISGKMNVPANSTESYQVPDQTGYSYNWSVSGGSIASGQGTNTISVDWGSEGSGTIEVYGDNGTCPISSSIDTAVNKYVVIYSNSSGRWDKTNPPGGETWDCACVPGPTDNVVIKGPHTIELGQDREINNITVQAGGVLDDQGNNFLIKGGFTINGRYSGTGDLNLNGSGTYIDGSGIIDNTGALILSGGSKTILSGSAFTRSSGDLQLNDITVFNEGSVSLTTNLRGQSSNSIWVNEENAALKINGNLLNTGTLVASAANNTVNYSGSGDQTVKTPSNGTYHRLTTSNAGTKTLSGNLTLNGNLNISGGSQLDVSLSNYTLSLKGTFNSTSSHTDPFVERSGLIILDGDGNQSIVSPARVTFNSVTIGSNATFTIGSGNSLVAKNSLIIHGTLQNDGGFKVAGGVQINGTLSGSGNDTLSGGDWNNSGQFNGTGKVVFNGTLTQSIQGSTRFQDLVLDNPTTVNNASGLQEIAPTGSIQLQQGSFATNDQVKLLSNSSGTARISEVTGDTIIGKVTAQRFISSGNAGWIDLAPPTGGALVSDWDDDIYLSGKSTGGFLDGCAVSLSGGCFWSVKSDDGSGAGTLTNITNTGTALEKGKGYELFIGDEGGVNVMATDTTISISGSVNAGTFSVPVTGTNGGWNLISNPYASPVHLDSVYQNNNIGGTFYIAAATGNYEFYDATSGSASGPVPSDGIISSSQAFWIQSNDGSDVVFKQSFKANNGSSFSKDNIPQLPYNSLGIKVENKSNSLSCESYVQLDPNSSPSWDEKDLPFLRTPIQFAPSLTFPQDTQQLRRSVIPEEDSIGIPIKVETPLPGQYQLSFQDGGLMDNYSCSFLLNMATSHRHQVNSGGTIPITVQDTLSGKQHDYTLLLKKKGCTTAMNNASNNNRVQAYPSGKGKVTVFTDLSKKEAVSVSILDVSGRILKRPEPYPSSEQVNTFNLPSSQGIYLIRVSSGTMVETFRIIR